MLYDSVLSLRRQTTSAHGHEMSCERYTRPQLNSGRLASWLLTAESSLRACVAEVATVEAGRSLPLSGRRAPTTHDTLRLRD